MAIDYPGITIKTQHLCIKIKVLIKKIIIWSWILYISFKNPCLNDNRRLKQSFLSYFFLHLPQEVIYQIWLHQPFKSCRYTLQTASIFRFYLSMSNEKIILLQAILQTGIGQFFKVREVDRVHQLQFRDINYSPNL